MVSWLSKIPSSFCIGSPWIFHTTESFSAKDTGSVTWPGWRRHLCSGACHFDFVMPCLCVPQTLVEAGVHPGYLVTIFNDAQTRIN